jgi:SAM-dependent methyltransferase
MNLHLPITTHTDFIWNGLSATARGTLLQYIALFVFVGVNTFAFVPLGQILGEEFDRMPPLRAYSVNVFGALLGVGAFALFSQLRISPVGWYACGLLLLVPFMPPSLKSYGGLAACLALAVLGGWEANSYWSPYYKITAEPLHDPTLPDPHNMLISVNEDAHQSAVNLKGKPNHPRTRVYDIPYKFGTPGDVLIVGAGSGNDVAAALRAGAKSVHAVEIDPVILELGKRHPEQPYADKRVTAINRDARGYVRHTDLKFDHIVLGYLDSHTLFSAMSSVRLDNFVYTVEFMQELKKHLKPEGTITLTFTVHEKWIADRLYAMLDTAFGAPPLVYMTRQQGFATIYFAGDMLRKLKPHYIDYDPTVQRALETWVHDPELEGFLAPSVFSKRANVDVPVDDWPYLYLQAREIPANYLWTLVFMLAFALMFVRRKAGGLHKIDAHFFLLGSGFLLIETKAMTELGIFLGSTWIVNAFVIAMVLALILAANWIAAQAWCPSIASVYGALGVVLLASWAVPIRGLLEWDSPLRNLVAVSVLCAPLFFAGIVFARQIKQHAQPSVALGSNLMGALVGGALEYCSMAYGFRALYLLAFAVYGLSYLALVRERSTGVAAVAPSVRPAV